MRDLARAVRLFGTLVVTSCVAVACGGDDDDDDGNMTPTPTQDSGSQQPMTPVDSGTTAKPDASTPTDSGSPMDSGADSGTDSGTDAGGGEDSGMDAGVDSGPDEDAGPDCSGVSDPCTVAGTSCDGTDLVTCAENSDGCLVETTTSCTSGGNNYCNSSASPPACANDPCLDVANPCDTEGVTCDDEELVTCAKDSNDCLVEMRLDCTTHDDDNWCDPDLATPDCFKDKCRNQDGSEKDDVCLVDETTCADDIKVECVLDADECPIATRTDCTTVENKNFCDATLDPPDCGFDPCRELDNQCFVEKSECDGTEVVTCEEDNGCLVENRHDCLDDGVGMTCDDSGGTPGCVACTDDADCDSADDGDVLCVGDDRVECVMNADGCLDAVRQSCGDDFECCDPAVDDTNCPTAAGPVCAYVANAACDSVVSEVLDAAASYGPFDTAGQGNDFNGYPCPDPDMPFVANGADLLFAIDIPAGTAMTVSFESLNYSGLIGGWMEQLTECADDGSDLAEDTCVGVANTSITQANESNVTQRYYLVVDGETGTSGTFGLAADIRPLDCGDGHQDGSEECDDGNVDPGDGCGSDCMLEENFRCTQSTQSTPSVCTRWPDDGICGNVQCDDVPADAPEGTELCCMPSSECGVAYPYYYGSSCMLRDQEGDADNACPSEDAGFLLQLFFGFDQLEGCCRPEDNMCGLITNHGAGCVKRSEVWAGMLDGAAVGAYDGPFTDQGCTP